MDLPFKIIVYSILIVGIGMIGFSVYSAICYLRPVERRGKVPHWDLASSMLMFSAGCIITTICWLMVSA